MWIVGVSHQRVEQKVQVTSAYQSLAIGYTLDNLREVIGRA